MKNLLTLLFFLCLASTVSAGVRSLGGESTSPVSSKKVETTNISTTPSISFKEIDTAKRCMNQGFPLRKCPANYIGVYPCPENNMYFRDCCPKEYRYTKHQCAQKNLEPSEEACLGFHTCQPKGTAEKIEKALDILATKKAVDLQTTKKVISIQPAEAAKK